MAPKGPRKKERTRYSKNWRVPKIIAVLEGAEQAEEEGAHEVLAEAEEAKEVRDHREVLEGAEGQELGPQQVGKCTPSRPPAVPRGGGPTGLGIGKVKTSKWLMAAKRKFTN
jgi:hypothetical protein